MGKARKRKRNQKATFNRDDLLDRSSPSPSRFVATLAKPIDRWLGLGATVVGILLYLLSKTPEVVVGCLVAILVLLLHPVWNFWWIEDATWRRASAVAVLIAALALVGYVSWPVVPPVPEALFDSQVQELNKLNDFVGGKVEYGLDQMFDFPHILSFAIRTARSRLAPQMFSSPELAEIHRQLYSNDAEVDIRFGQPRSANGTYRFDPNPKQLAVIALSPQYFSAKKQLTSFEAEALLPSNIQNAVADLDRTVSQNATLLFDVLNEEMQRDPNAILFNDDPSSPYSGAAENAYYRAFHRLKPKADAIVEAIRRYLKVP
jgi:hypothetical protein